MDCVEKLIKNMKEVEMWYNTLQGGNKLKVDALLKEVANDGNSTDPFSISVRFFEELLYRAENKA